MMAFTMMAYLLLYYFDASTGSGKVLSFGVQTVLLSVV